MLNNISTLSYEFIECILITAVGNIDIRPSLVEINYFEDIFTPGFSGYLYMNDSLCLHNQLSLIGDEFVRFMINKPGNPTPIIRYARVYSISKRHLTNDDNENYILNFCSEEYFLNEEIKVSKSYTNKYIHEIVQDIAFNYLKIPEEEFPSWHIEKTFGLRHIIIPNLKPLEAINWLATLAISAELPEPMSSGASYLFYNNKHGYWFHTILDIFNRTQKETTNPRGWSQYMGYGGDGSGYWYGVKNADEEFWNKNYYEGNDKLGKMDPAEQITSYENLNSYDVMECVQKGMFCNRLIAVDYIKRTHTDCDFKYTEYWDYIHNNIDVYKNWNIYPIMSDAVDRIGNPHDAYVTDVIKCHPSGKNMVEIYIPYRFAQLSLIGFNRYKLSIPGDPNIRVGVVIYIHMPQTAKDDGGWKLKDRFLSGRYLVTTVRHKLDQENNFETTIEVMKDAFTEVNETHGLISFGNNQTLQEARARDRFDYNNFN